jgi:formamidopyrimidine-DNA glycosylase
MPELPEIEALRRDMAEHALNRRIAAVDLRDPDRLRGARPDDLTAALEGWHFDAVGRHGKILVFGVSCGWKLAVHFGMNGTLVAYGAGDAEPAHTRLDLRFDDGGHLAYADLRRLGWVELTDDIAVYLRSQDIGPDALAVDAETFAKGLAGKRGAIKTALMDQALVAGVGNVYADEILFHAGIAPARRANELTADAIARVHARMRSVLAEAAARGGFGGDLPATWLLPHRGDGGCCPACGTALQRTTLGGRTTYACPACQA